MGANAWIGFNLIFVQKSFFMFSFLKINLAKAIHCKKTYLGPFFLKLYVIFEFYPNSKKNWNNLVGFELIFSIAYPQAQHNLV